ncbi:hypothetical protein NC651_009229 [Populus alba x Populus x berolinensis]|nr:hypothetical protein NC651_009229 [Populus alba x Populus x berolinensis]
MFHCKQKFCFFSAQQELMLLLRPMVLLKTITIRSRIRQDQWRMHGGIPIVFPCRGNYWFGNGQ